MEKDYYPLASTEAPIAKRFYLRATPTGEFRPPRKGEWYLSGAITEAYRARCDLGQPYKIATVVSGSVLWQPDC